MIVVKIKSQHRRSPTVFSNNGNLAMECSVYRYSLRDGQLYLVGSGNLADGRGEMYSFDINFEVLHCSSPLRRFFSLHITIALQNVIFNRPSLTSIYPCARRRFEPVDIPVDI